MNERIQYSTTAESALVTIAAPRRPVLVVAMALQLVVLSLMALGWFALACALFFTFDPQSIGLGVVIAAPSLGMMWLVPYLARRHLGWELFGREEIRVTGAGISVDRIVPRVLVTNVGARPLAAVRRIFVASRFEWQTLGGRATMYPQTWIVVVAENARQDLQFGLSIGESDAQQLASFLVSEMDRRGAPACAESSAA